MKRVFFKAPWGLPLALMTLVCTTICFVLPIPGLMIASGRPAALHALGLTTLPPMLEWSGWLMVAVPLLSWLVSAFFMVRCYELTDASLNIKRLGWQSRLDLSRFISATVDPEALRGSLRLFGNGGLFAFTGWFRNKKLGVYHAYATDAPRAVVLRFSDKTVVITPDDPQKFVTEINSNKRTPS